MSKRTKTIEQFTRWLSERGAEVLAPTNEWELVRFRGGGVTSIIYNSKTGSMTFTGQARVAYDAFSKNDPDYRIQPGTYRKRHGSDRRKVERKTLIERDGNACFYCGDHFTDTKPPTREHLISLTHSGPDRLENLFLACQPCNIRAGHLSAPEKIKLRDEIRAERCAAVLASSAAALGLLQTLPDHGEDR